MDNERLERWKIRCRACNRYFWNDLGACPRCGETNATPLIEPAIAARPAQDAKPQSWGEKTAAEIESSGMSGIDYYTRGPGKPTRLQALAIVATLAIFSVLMRRIGPTTLIGTVETFLGLSLIAVIMIFVLTVLHWTVASSRA